MSDEPKGNSQLSERTLLELYKIAVDVDKYELDLGWKLVQFFSALNSGLLTIGFSLLGSDQLTANYYIVPIFAIGIVTSIVAILSRISYHEHSLRADYKRILIEHELGLYRRFEKEGYEEHALAIATTSNKNKDREVLKEPDKWLKKRLRKVGTVPFYHNVIFVAFTFANIVGLWYSAQPLI
jgi:hypothetical protein